MNAGVTCRECGKAIPAESPGGFCAQCLLSLGLDLSAGGPTSQTEGHTRTSFIAAPLTEKPGDRIGRYRLLQEIGQGGCGVVYMAEQEEPVRRRVALKVIKLGMDTKQVVARFDAERQALALMDHPNIAKVLDAGATEAGRPYFVMELVRGIRITDYCDQNKLPTSERLKLFTQVCQAIQHAHQKGIIHRDIKPSNILVTLHDGVPVPKVIDFGIAKATQGRLTDQTLFTAFEQFIGTPAYMSPEQVEMSGLDIDTRSDIYSLGVLLYELLVGTTPFGAEELLAAGLEQMRRTIREQEPVRPSTRLSTMVEGELTTTAKRRQTDAPKLIHLVRGDLDWIVMKCLEKDRTRRYDTANGLALDIHRHLSQEPVMARPPSTVYRIQKFVSRNKVMVTAVVLVLVVLVLGMVVSTWQAIEATLAKREQIRLRGQAQTQERATRLRAYASEVSVALQAWEEGNPSRARALLERQRPKPGEEDLRGFEWRYLYGLVKPRELATLALHNGKGEVVGSAWSPDGKFLALGGFSTPDVEGRIELWDWDTRKIVNVIPAPAPVYNLAFSPDSSKLAYPIGTDNGPTNLLGVAVWDIRSQRIIDQLMSPDPGGWPFVAFSHSGQLVAYVISHTYRIADKSRIVICDLTKQSPPFDLTGSNMSACGPDFSPDDQILVTPHGDGTVILWDLKNRTILQRLSGHRGIVWFAKFSPDGKTLATGGIDGTVRLWDLGDHTTPISSLTLGTHDSSVFGLSFSPNGKLLVSASLDHTAKVWDVAERKEVETLRGHDQRVWSASFSPDGRFIMTGSWEGNVKIWRTPEIAADEPLDTHPVDGYTAVEFSPDSRWLLAGEESQTKLWEIPSRRKRTLDLVRCRFSPARNFLAGFNTNGQLTLLNVSNQEFRPVVILPDQPAFRRDVDPIFSADGQMLAAARTNGELTIWSLAAEVPRQVRALTNAAAPDPAPVFAPDGRVLAIRSDSDTVAIWNWVQGRLIARLHDGMPAKHIQFYSFSPSGGAFVTKYEDDSVRLWETAGWNQRELITGDLHHPDFSGDGRWLASGCDFHTNVKLWDMSRHTLEEFPSGSGPIGCLAFSPDVRTLAVGTEDGWVNLWHLPSRQQVVSIKAHRSIVNRVVFSPDGRFLASSGIDGKLRLWSAPSLAETDATKD